jgi:hypothetical protein
VLRVAAPRRRGREQRTWRGCSAHDNGEEALTTAARRTAGAVLGLVRGEAKRKKLELGNATLLKENGRAEMLKAVQVASLNATRDSSGKRWLGAERLGTEWRTHGRSSSGQWCRKAVQQQCWASGYLHAEAKTQNDA